MANKFLPFVVESSTPVHIYQTLVSRSKGVIPHVMASVFAITVKHGILAVRAFVQELPNLEASAIYDSIMQKYPENRVSKEKLKVYLDFLDFLTPEDWGNVSPEVTQFDPLDRLTFLYTMSANGTLEEYTTLPFKSMEEKGAYVLNNVDQFVRFSDMGEQVAFDGADDLRAYIFYHSFFKAIKSAPIRATFTHSGDE